MRHPSPSRSRRSRFAAFTAIFAARSGVRASRADAWITGVARRHGDVRRARRARRAHLAQRRRRGRRSGRRSSFPTLVFALPALVGAVVTEWREAGGGPHRAPARSRRGGAATAGEPRRASSRAARPSSSSASSASARVGHRRRAHPARRRGRRAVRGGARRRARRDGASRSRSSPTCRPSWCGASRSSPGPGFAVGAGTSVSPAGTQVGVVPGIPILGIIPESTTPWLLLLALGPIALGALAGWIARSRSCAGSAPRRPWRPRRCAGVDEAAAAADAAPSPGPRARDRPAPIGARLVIALGSRSRGGGRGAARLRRVGLDRTRSARRDGTRSPARSRSRVGLEVLVGAGILLLAPRARRRADDRTRRLRRAATTRDAAPPAAGERVGEAQRPMPRRLGRRPSPSSRCRRRRRTSRALRLPDAAAPRRIRRATPAKAAERAGRLAACSRSPSSSRAPGRICGLSSMRRPTPTSRRGSSSSAPTARPRASRTRRSTASRPSWSRGSQFESREEWGAELGAQLAVWKPDLVVLSGLMRLLPAALVDEWSPRIVNTHPAYLPEFPGAHGVRDALAAGVAADRRERHHRRQRRRHRTDPRAGARARAPRRRRARAARSHQARRAPPAHRRRPPHRHRRARSRRRCRRASTGDDRVPTSLPS